MSRQRAFIPRARTVPPQRLPRACGRACRCANELTPLLGEKSIRKLRWVRILVPLALFGVGPMCGCVVQPPAAIERAALPAGALPAPSGPEAGALQQQPWWQTFQDGQLNGLIRHALCSAPDLAVARSRIEQGNAALQLALAETGVRIGAGAELSRGRISHTGVAGRASDLLGTDWYNLGNLGINIAVAIDSSGRRKAEIAASAGRAHAAAAEGQMAHLVITSGLAGAYFNWQADSARQDIVNELISVLERMRALQVQLVTQGLAPEISLTEVTVQIENTKELAKTVNFARELGELSIAAMIGIPVDQLRSLELRRLSIDQFRLPEMVTVAVIAQRPDLMALRWTVEAAVQDVARARAAYFPDLRLSALAGLSSTDLNEVLNPASRIFHAGAAVYLPFFDASRVRARYGVTRAQMETAIAVYNAAVEDAIREVAEGASRLQMQQARYVSAGHRVAAKRKSYLSMRDLARHGIQDERSVLQAQSEVLVETEASLRVQGEVASAYVRLMMAMGAATGVNEREENARLE